MSEAEVGGVHEWVGALTKGIRIRVLNCSPIGVLLESASPLAVGTVAALSVRFGDRQFADTISVVRCQLIGSMSGVYHVGAEFVTVAPPYAGSLRYAMRCEREALVGWLSINKT